MKNICITGISGYLGKRLVEELSQRDDIGKILGLDIAPFTQESDKVDFHKMDIRNPDIEKLLSDNNIDTVFHLAFIVQPIHDRKLMHDVDYNGTVNILNASVRAKVKHIIAISSTLGYGAYQDNPEKLKESDKMRGKKIFPYGDEKAAVDNMIQNFAAEHSETIITTLRPCTVFGPEVRNYIYRMLFQPVSVSISGFNPSFQFVHEDDFVRACIVSMEKQAPGAFNIAGDGTLTTREISEMIGSKVIPVKSWVIYFLMELMWKLRVKKIESNRGILEYVRYSFVADNEKAKKELGFYPEYTSVQTLQETIKSRDERRKKNRKTRNKKKRANAMMNLLRVRRKNRYEEFTIQNKLLNSILLVMLFTCGLYISHSMGIPAIIIYAALWVLSYIVIYAGTCRYCAYYGKGCPIPLEGSMAHRFFSKKEGGFGASQLGWAFVSYLMRIAVPMFIVFYQGMIIPGIIFFAIFSFFGIVHQQIAGCPNCINESCPLNPDYGKS